MKITCTSIMRDRVERRKTMRKIGMIVALGLALLLGPTRSAAALTINNAPAGEKSLYEIVNYFVTLGGSYPDPFSSNADLISAYSPVLETLPPPPPGGYALTGYYASYAHFTQQAGTYPAGGGSITFIGSIFPTSPDQNAIIALGSPIYLTPSDPSVRLGFADSTDGGGIKYTELGLNSGSPSQSCGLIFQVSFTQYIIAFEDGGGTQPLGDSDYNDLVLFVTRSFEPIPLPPSAVLLGSGLLGLVGLGWRRRKS
jgi:hypothetical protein